MNKIGEIIEYVKLIPIRVEVWKQIKLWELEEYMDGYFKWFKK